LEIIIIVILVVLLVWLAVIFNKFVRGKNLISEAWSGIDVQLKRRHDLIPNLVEAVKGYSSHERNLFQQIAETRSKTMSLDSLKEKAAGETQLSGMLRSLFAVAEAYPDLKANQNFLDLQKQLAETEDQIQYARRYYNGVVRNYNIRVQSFPSNLVALVFGYKEAEFFEITLSNERETPEVKL
jgi:LemA protein